LTHSEEDEAFARTASAVALGVMNTTQQSLMAMLNRRLNFQVKEIEIWEEPRTCITHVAVVFMNGHHLKTTLADVRSDEFLATCVMVYDLPPKR
jgi:hypothetical protein